MYLGKSFSAVNQITYEIQISNNFKYLEFLEQGKIEALKNLFKMNIDCMSASYKDNLESFFGERSQSPIAVKESEAVYY